MTDVAAPSLPLFTFDHNWSRPPSITNQFETPIIRNLDATEQRRSIRGKQRRAQDISNLSISTTSVGGLKQYLRDRTQARHYTPLFADERTLDTAAPTSSTTLSISTTHRRFFAGSMVLIVKWDNDTGRAAKIEVATVLSVQTNSITLTSGTTNAFDVGDSVYPCFVAEAASSTTFRLQTDQVAVFSGSLDEVVGTFALPATIDANTTPTGMTEYRGLPVLDLPSDWSNISEGTSRRGRRTEVGLDTLIELYGDGPQITARIPYRGLERDEFWTLLQFFESRRGAAFPFWYPHHGAELDLRAASPLALAVSQDIEQSRIEEMGFVSIWYKDGSVVVRAVTTVLDQGGLYLLALDQSISTTEIDYVSFASLARLASDEMVEQWQTTEVCNTELQVQGLQWSGNISCTGMDCEKGNCTEEGDCPEPGTPLGEGPPCDPYTPDGGCNAGEVAVPYFYDLTQTWNSGREPIRAADFMAPSNCVVTIRDGLVFDANHPFGQDISDELKEALFQSHLLEYVGLMDRTAKSRNPYHTRVSGVTLGYSGRSGGENVEDSPYWEAEVEYKINKDTPQEETHTLTIRLYSEWVNQGAGDTEYGLWGAAWVLWAWTTEHETAINYTDGNTYTPFNNNTFTEEDPFVGGTYANGGSSDKYMHPMALFVAMAPTTWHSPIGYDFHSLLDRDQYRHECFKEQNGAPWSNGGPGDASGNAVYGTTVGGAKMRAIGALGGWTKTSFFNWMCIENAAGTGMTILKPGSAGWDETEGELSGGSDISIDMCSPKSVGINKCSGHPDAPYNGNGGTHEVWRTGEIAGSLDRLCVGTSSTGTMKHTGKGVTEKTKYDDNCLGIEYDCQVTRTFTNTISGLEVENYTFGSPGYPSHNIDLRKFEDDPDYVTVNFPNADLCDGDDEDSCWERDFGTWSLMDDASTTLSGYSTARSTVQACQQYDVPSEADVQDGGISAEFPWSGTGKHGVAIRETNSSGRSNAGYILIADEAALTVTLYKMTGSDAWAVIDSDTFTEPGDGVMRVAITARGHDISGTAADGSVSSVDCDWDSGRPALVSAGDSLDSPVTFSNVGVSDNNFEKVEPRIDIDNSGRVTASMPFKLSKTWQQTRPGMTYDGSCEPEDCPRDDMNDCQGPCTEICKGTGQTGLGGGATSLDTDGWPNGPIEGKNDGLEIPPLRVGQCDEESCSPPFPNCEDCPPYYVGFSITFSGAEGMEGEDLEDGDHSPFIGGADHWVWANAFCV